MVDVADEQIKQMKTQNDKYSEEIAIVRQQLEELRGEKEVLETKLKHSSSRKEIGAATNGPSESEFADSK